MYSTALVEEESLCSYPNLSTTQHLQPWLWPVNKPSVAHTHKEATRKSCHNLHTHHYYLVVHISDHHQNSWWKPMVKMFCLRWYWSAAMWLAWWRPSRTKPGLMIHHLQVYQKALYLALLRLMDYCERQQSQFVRVSGPQKLTQKFGLWLHLEMVNSLFGSPTKPY